MLERPDLDESIVVDRLRRAWGILAEVRFMPVGFDPRAWAYDVRSGAGERFFLKIRQGTTELAAAVVPRHLHDRGLWQVVAPLSTLDGQPWHRAEGYQFVLYPFVVGPRAAEAGLTDGQWREFGAFLGALHRMDLPSGVAALVPEETFVCPSVENVRSLAERVHGPLPDDPVSRELVECWRENDDEITVLVRRTERLGDLVRARGLPPVLCHADIHAHNILVDGEGGLHVVDWDAPVRAPCERDLMFVVGECAEPQEALFWQGYGRYDVDRPALAYYRHARVVEDIDAFAHGVLLRDDVGELTRHNDLDWFRVQFAPGSSVDQARDADRRIGEP